jgi:hypothetical protein
VLIPKFAIPLFFLQQPGASRSDRQAVRKR